MNEYHKIDSVYKRNERGRFIVGDWAKPEFEYLADKPWYWTEKIDGTNIRVMLDVREERKAPYIPTTPEHVVRYGGKTDNAQIPNKLVNWLNENITVKTFLSACLESPMTLYGEGYGAGIQSGGNYSPEQKFILFDVKIGDWWLERENVVDIANKLGLDVVPAHSVATLDEMINYVAMDSNNPQRSDLNPEAFAEGFVGTPTVPLFNRKGERIITKLKFKDFKEI